MDINALLIESLQLLGLGMGAVFVILVLLIGLISIVAKIVPEEVTAPATAAIPGGIDPQHVAAISAAIEQHRKTGH